MTAPRGVGSDDLFAMGTRELDVCHNRLIVFALADTVFPEQQAVTGGGVRHLQLTSSGPCQVKKRRP
jgi:hypothetical protein